MNNSSILIWYETGNCEEVHLSDPPYEADVTLQREYIDYSDPDKGIFLERTYASADEAVERTDDGADGEEVGYRLMMRRSRIISPEELESALLVIAHGVTVLRRDPLSESRCGLLPCAVEEVGYGPDDALRGAGYFVAGIERCCSALIGMGPEGETALTEALHRALEDCCGDYEMATVSEMEE